MLCFRNVIWGRAGDANAIARVRLAQSRFIHVESSGRTDYCATSVGWEPIPAKSEGVTAPFPVHKIARNLQASQYLANTFHIGADLFWKKIGLGPCSIENLRYGEVPMGMIEKELEELKLPACQRSFRAFVADNPPIRIQQETVKIPYTLVPELEPLLIALHLALDNLYVNRRRFMRDRRQFCQVTLDSIEEPTLEFE
jgi:hypothetical protein